MAPSLTMRERVELAPLTSLELGGCAAFFCEATDEQAIARACSVARERGLPIAVLGAGSNLVVADDGYPGMVIAIRTRGLELTPTSRGRVRVEAAAGEPWDALVELTVERGLAGLECLSGIPGLVGATPIQNVGAYGQEVADTIVGVRALDPRSGKVQELDHERCGFAYRDSVFKSGWARGLIVTSVMFELEPGGAPTVRYAELERALADRPRDLRTVREEVIALRRAKSMVIDPEDANRRSAGSFFTNPIVEAALAADLARRHPSMPRWPQPDGRVKLAAGWLIEQSGMHKGLRRGNVGISSRHALALVHHGGGTTRELLALAEEIGQAVRARFGVTLEREPVLWS